MTESYSPFNDARSRTGAPKRTSPPCARTNSAAGSGKSRDRDARAPADPVAPQRAHEARRAEALVAGDAGRDREPAQQAERGGQPQRAEMKSLRVADLERQPQPRVLRHADRSHDSPPLGVGG